MTALPDYDSPLALKAFLEQRGMGMQKKFGQNFLINRAQRECLVDELRLSENMSVWEIGPGLGSMTSAILERKADLVAFEIDRGFCEALRGFFVERENFTLIEGDVLRTWRNALETKGLPSRLFGNLPYNIAATILADTIAAGVRFDRVVVTVQKEVALRMAAKPSTEDYSSFSVLCQWAYDVSSVIDLAGGSFWPRPNIVSRAVRMTRKDDWPRCESPKVFMEILRALFSSRRKTVRNNLSAWFAVSARKGAETGRTVEERTAHVLADAKIDPGARAETLSVDDFLRISDSVVRL